MTKLSFRKYLIYCERNMFMTETESQSHVLRNIILKQKFPELHNKPTCKASYKGDKLNHSLTGSQVT